MEQDDVVFIGTLERTGVVETPEGKRLLIETEQGKFLLRCDGKTEVDALAISADMYTSDVVRGDV